MSGLLEKLEKRITKKIEERIGVLGPKLDKMIELLEEVEKNTRK